MGRPEVFIVRTGTANLASVRAGLERVGAQPRLVEQRAEIARASFIMVPGVGSFQAAMQRLEKDGFVAALRERLAAGRATLAICVGLQLLCEESEESPKVAGLGVMKARLARFPDTVRVPQIGWNAITPGAGCQLLRPGHAYFANSYRLTTAPNGWSAATADHGGVFIAGLERGPQLACQFHPELSGAWGLELLKGWLARGLEEGDG